MEIALHIGASCTDDERLIKSLLKNAGGFAKEGVAVPNPSTYRKLVRETLHNLGDSMPSPETREILIDAIVQDENAHRVILSNPDFICVPNRIFEGGEFYALAIQKLTGMEAIFDEDELTVYLGMRNPATFLPAVFAASKHDHFDQFMQGLSSYDVKWSSLIRHIRSAAPKAKVVAWCNEDAPFIWAQLIREVSGLGPKAKITGGFDMMASIISQEGMGRFSAYMKSNPPKTESQKQSIVSAFLEKYAIESEVIDEFYIPGWTNQTVQSLSDIYDADLAAIAEMEGVTLIEP